VTLTVAGMKAARRLLVSGRDAQLGILAAPVQPPHRQAVFSVRLKFSLSAFVRLRFLRVLFLKGDWGPNLCAVASTYQFTGSSDRGIQIGEAFNDAIPGLRMLCPQRIAAYDCRLWSRAKIRKHFVCGHASIVRALGR